jgi:SWI/SNF-related matrix-associated actin-dependent regulator of chromatin subfamily A member 5
MIDEAHRFKNERSPLRKAVNCENHEHHSRLLRLLVILIQQVLQNNVYELWALLNFLSPEICGSAEVLKC